MNEVFSFETEDGYIEQHYGYSVGELSERLALFNTKIKRVLTLEDAENIHKQQLGDKYRPIEERIKEGKECQVRHSDSPITEHKFVLKRKCT